jgi:hypothetical protein
MIHIASVPPRQFGVAGQISHSENPGLALRAGDRPAFWRPRLASSAAAEPLAVGVAGSKAFMIEDKTRIFDGFVALECGADAVCAPNLIDRNQVASAYNTVFPRRRQFCADCKYV